jgi:predicted phage terminase large subunit-like protein
MTSASEILRLRLAARGSLVEFARQVGYDAAPHHKLLAEKLEAVERGEIRKLCFNLPPGSGKTIWGNLWALWYMSRAPRSVLGASNVSDLAERFSRRIRGWAQQHGQTLGVQVDETTQSAAHWALSNGSTYTAASVGSSVLGLRCDVLYTDDPLRSREESLSQTARDNLWEWYHSSARTRLRPGGSEILVMTRFSEVDLAAQLLEREDDWTVINIPAECESAETDPLHRQPGQMLWPGSYGYADLLKEVKKTTLPEIWSALYQGRPAPESGEFFKAEYFKPMTVMPHRDQLHVYGASDYAVSAGRGDFTVHLVVGQSGDGALYLLDCWRKQADTAESIEAFCDLVLQWKPIGWAQETGQINSSIGPFMRVRQRVRNAWVPSETFPTRGDKSVRCQSIRGRLSLGGLFVNTQADWWAACRAEALSFPVHAHDDFCDALGLVGQILDRMSAPFAPKPKEEPKRLVIGGPGTNICMEDLWREEERRVSKYRSSGRIK